MLNANKTQRREKLVVAGLASLIFGAEDSRPADWVRPTMPGDTQHPAQALMLGIEAVKFSARPYETDTNKGGSAEWNQDLEWLRRFMQFVWEMRTDDTESMHEWLASLAATALGLTERHVMLEARPEIAELLELLSGVAEMIKPSEACSQRIIAYCRHQGLFPQES